MKQKFLTTLAFVILTMAITAATARAQTVANGPYYAPPAWDQTLPVATRFIVLSNFASAAVLDRETGLVWEKSPATTTHTWISARFQCTSRVVGGRKGWRLPSVHELASLLDPSVPFPGPVLPAGHPFTNVQSSPYWSATTNADFTSDAWEVGFGSGNTSDAPKNTPDFARAWCVRGGMNADQY
jgi:hypothetical protein